LKFEIPTKCRSDRDAEGIILSESLIQRGAKVASILTSFIHKPSSYKVEAREEGLNELLLTGRRQALEDDYEKL